jgi:folate-binding protein YgfZ
VEGLEMFELRQYESAREGAGLIDRSDRGKIAVAGIDHVSFLNAMLTNDIAALKAGAGCYAALLTPQGRMITDVRVIELGDMALLDVHRSVAKPFIERMDQFIFSEDVRLGDLTEAFDQIRVVGPDAARAVASALREAAAEDQGLPAAGDLAGFAEFRSVRLPFRGSAVVIVATREAGVPGFDLYIERKDAAVLRRTLVEAGATEVSEETSDVLRVEAGIPVFPIDMDTETIPLEAGIEGRAISFTKGCYPGQEVIIRVLHRGHGRVAKRLVGLSLAGDEVPARGDTLWVGEKEIGRITSAVLSPALGRPIALGYLHHDFTQPGTSVVVLHGDRRLEAVVTTPPFVPA